MPDQVIICPHCKKEIPLTEAITHQIKENLRQDFEKESKKKEDEFRQKEEVLSKKAKELENTKRSLDEQVEQKVKTEREKIEKEAKEKAEKNVSLVLKDLQEELNEKGQKLQKAQEMELKLRKQQRELEESKNDFELEMTRKLDEERKKIKESVEKTILEEHRLKDLEKEKQISDLIEQIKVLKRKAEQGSQQTQGEVLELELEDILRANFPSDLIEPVPKGIRGADVLQKVHNQVGQYCGTIIWESKQTKAWSDSWIPKLKEDQREVKAEIAVILSTVLPKDINNFGCSNGVWITDYASVIGIATSLRINLIQVAHTRLATVGKNEKIEVLYNYLSGPEFKHRVEAIVEAFSTMKKDLDQEKRATMRIWAKREKQIERVINNTVGMYGDLQGIIGASLPQIESLELEAIAEEDEEIEEDDNSGLPF